MNEDMELTMGAVPQGTQEPVEMPEAEVRHPTYPEKRKLDPIAFRVRREEGWETACLTDLTVEERIGILGDRDVDYLMELVLVLADRLRGIGDQLDLRVSDDAPEKDGGDAEGEL